MKNLNTLLAITALSLTTWAAPQTFDFKDPKGVNNAVFNLDAPLEAISGSASGVTGTVQFDPANPAATKGKIVIATPTLHVGNPMMKEHLHGANWLDVKKHPEISFDVKELKNAKTTGDVTSADAVGTFTIKGIAKEKTIPVKLTYLKDKLGQRVPNQKGDLLVIRSTFQLKRSEFDLMAGKNEDKVSDTIDVTLSIAGASPK